MDKAPGWIKDGKHSSFPAQLDNVDEGVSESKAGFLHWVTWFWEGLPGKAGGSLELQSWEPLNVTGTAIRPS